MNLPTKEEQILAAKFLETHGFKNNAALLRAIARGDLVVCERKRLLHHPDYPLDGYALATSIPEPKP
jgi:hypothetical protein